MSYDRGRDTSSELVEVRTVLGRAETAVISLDRAIALGDRHLDWKCKRDGDCTNEEHWHRTDPDAQEMREALQETVTRLDHWRRTGTKRKNRP